MKKTICALVLSLVPSTANAEIFLNGLPAGTYANMGYIVPDYSDDINYKIKKGDNLYKIARNLCKSNNPDHLVGYIVYHNGIEDRNKIKEGVYIYLPSNCK